MAEYSMAIVLSADGTAMIGTFDTATNSMVKLQSVAEATNEGLKDTGAAGSVAAEGLKKTGDQADASRKKIGELGAALEQKLALAAKAGLAGLAALVGVAINTADKAGKLAEKLGVTTEFISGMGYVADQSGANLSVLSSGLGELADNAVKAASGNRQSAASFAAIGVNVLDASGKLRSLEDMLPEIANRFAGMENGVAKAALAQKLFGAGGRELIPTLNLGAKGIADMRKEAAEFGLEISGKTAQSASAFGDNLGKLKAQFLGIATTLAERMLPYLVTITEHTDSIVNIITLLGSVAAAVYAGKLVRGALDYGSALADLVIKNQAVAAAEGARGVASQTGLMASIKSVGALQASFMVLQAAVIGWSIGTYLRDEFVDVRLFGLAFVETMLVGWERIKQFANIAWAGVKAGFSGAINIMREQLANFVGMYGQALALLPKKLGGEQIAAKLKEWETALRPTTKALDELNAAVAEADAEFEKNKNHIREVAGGLAQYEIEADAAAKATDKQKDEVKALTIELPRLGKASDDVGEATTDLRSDFEKLADSLVENREEVELLHAAMDIEIAKGREASDVVAELERGYDMLRLAREDLSEATINYDTIVRDLNASYDEELRLVGLSNEQRVIEEQLLRAVGDAQRDGVDLSQEEQDALRTLIGVREQHLAAVQRERDIVESNQGIIREGFYSLLDATKAFATGGISSLKDLGRQGVDIIKRMVVDMLANVFKMRVVEPFLRNLFSGGASGGGGGWGNLIGSFIGGGTGGGGSGNMVGSLLSMAGGSGGGGSSNPWLSMVAGGGSNGGMLSSLGGMFGGGGYGAVGATPIGSVGPVAGGYAYPTAGGAGPALGPLGSAAAGIGGAIYGYNRTNGGGAGLAAGAAYGAAGIAVAGTAAGLAGGATIGAAAGGAFAGLGAAAAIPVVGWILAALAFIDFASGGKLFGTKFRADSVTQSLSIGADGGDASVSLREVRNRSLFRGRQWRNSELDASPEAEQGADRLFQAARDAGETIARVLGTEIPDVIDASIRTVTEYTKKGKEKSTKIFVDIAGQMPREEKDMETAVTRVIAESWINALDAAAREIDTRAAPLLSEEAIDKMLSGKGFASSTGFTLRDGDGGDGGFGGAGGNGGTAAQSSEIQRLANRWRGDANTLMDGARFLFAAFEANKRGLGLLGESGTLTQITDVVEDMLRGEETLTETFTRLLSNTELYRDVLKRMGKSLGIEAVALVEISTEIVDAAGGLKEAQDMWRAYFDGFYTAAERAQFAQEQLMSTFGTQAESLGLDENITAAQFRAAFEAALPTLSGDEIVAWQQFGQVLLQVANARNAVMQAEQAHAQWTEQLTTETTGIVESGYQQAVRAIRNATAQHIANADALAQAQGRAGASTADLALISRWAARQFELAKQALEAVVQDLASQLGYGALAQIDAQIALLEADGENATSSIENATAASADFFQQFEDGMRGLNEYFDSLLLGDLSPLSPEEQIAEARAQLEANAAAVRGGDVGALSQSQGLIDTFLRLMRGHEASGDDYRQEFDWARSLYAGIANPYSPAGGGVPSSVELVPSPALEALYLARDQAMLDAEAARRAALAVELAARIGELMHATGENLSQVATRLGVPLDRLVADLTGMSISIDNLTGATTQQLGGVANRVGIELGELATALGFELGRITDANSLANDALELVLAGLPDEFRNQLEPLLRDVETASGPGEQVDAIEELERVTGLLPEELRLLLAPYLDAIDPLDPSVFTDLDYLESVDANTGRANLILQGILDYFTGGGSIDDPPGDGGDPTSIGGGGLRAAVAAKLTSVDSGGQAQAAMLVELQKLRSEVATLSDRLEQATNRNTDAVRGGAERVVTGTEESVRKLGDDIRSNARNAA